METVKNITVIPARRRVGNTAKESEIPKLRVAAYCRVSTDSDEQATSYEAQVEHYTDYIRKNPEWEFAGIFADDGISGTNTKKREEFNRMIDEAMAGKIDMIVTKSMHCPALCIVPNAGTSTAGLYGITEESDLSCGAAAPGWNTVREPAMPMLSMNQNYKTLWFEPLTWHLAKRILCTMSCSEM